MAESTEIRLATGAKRKKLGGYDFYREVLGNPKFIVAARSIRVSWCVFFHSLFLLRQPILILNGLISSSGLEKTFEAVWCSGELSFRPRTEL